MSAAAIAQLILMAAQMTPQLIAMANQLKTGMSAEDQATIDAAIDQARAQALASLSTAEADLDAAARA